MSTHSRGSQYIDAALDAYRLVLIAWCLSLIVYPHRTIFRVHSALERGLGVLI